jgi:YebC/PmpR family DNA-binding regulatory protein
MSGHSKWATIKRKKGAVDAARGKIFTKLVREITTAARMGGGDASGNSRLRTAVAAAKAQSMPSDKIDRAIKKGTGELEGPALEDTSYEGYGPAGVAIYIEAQTDNRNRTTGDIRMVLTKNNGTFGAAGSVAWMFHKRGQFTFDASKYTEDEIMEAALEAGADDVKTEGDAVVVYTEPKLFIDVLDHFDKVGIKYTDAELTMVPDTTVKVAGQDAERVLRLVERLEELDDVQKVHANFDIDESELERIASQG